MRLQSKNINKLGVITPCYIVILLQVVFRIWLCIPDMHWAGNNICAWVDSIQSGINLKYIPIPSPLQSKLIIITYKKKQNINLLHN